MMNSVLGQKVCSNLKLAESREWLVTNGIGGYASGTIPGVLTRRYHGLLMAALQPPVGRTLLLTKLDETVNYNGQSFKLSTNRWADATVNPQGYSHLKRFHLEGTTPVWNFAFSDGLLEKRIWMERGENTTYIYYRYKRGNQPLNLSLQALVNYRDYHSKTGGNSLFSVDKVKEQGLKVQAFPDAASLYLSAYSGEQESNFRWETKNIWYRNFALAVEKYRGLDHLEDHLHIATGNVTLQPGEFVIVEASTQENREVGGWGDGEIRRLGGLLDTFYSRNQLENAPTWIKNLVLAADQFIVNRPLADNPGGKTIIAGYPWFTDWGRDTMISLPGLTIATGRYDIAKTILLTFAKYVDQGMLPNVFPDGGETPGYNTLDATLWYFEAIRSYYAATADGEFLAELFPLLTDIIDWHIKGTRYNIHMDNDGLIYGGEEGMQLTWMDAKVGDWVVTPRIGKPVEINALWYNALVCMNYFANVLGKSGIKYQQLAEKVRSHFSKFWYEEGGYCYDVIDSPQGNDPSFRPNQIFAVSLPAMDSNHSLLKQGRQKMIVDKVEEKLLTPFGLRSLSPEHPDYVGIYGGNQLKRDGSYHQGTTWSWLIGHFVQAHLKVYQNPQLARSFLEPMANHLQDGCIGSISEIFDGDPPFTPRGCFAQAWSVAEVLRGWLISN